MIVKRIIASALYHVSTRQRDIAVSNPYSDAYQQLLPILVTLNTSDMVYLIGVYRLTLPIQRLCSTQDWFGKFHLK